jgi:RimJ/RimL family protein N-acetyltransferase
VLVENERAIRLYERLGWQRTGETRPSPSLPNPTLVAYRLDLEPVTPSA